MDRNYFEDEKLQYENIDIPEELDFIVNKTLKEGRRVRNRKKAYKWTSGIAASFLAFVLLVNMFPKVAYAASLIPGLGKLVELVTFDKGFTNAIDSGLSKELNYVEEKEGVKLIINGLVGDYKALWVDYELIGNDLYDMDVRVKDSETGEDIPVGISFNYKEVGKTEDGYLVISFLEYIENFDLEIKVGKKEVNNESITIADKLAKEEYIEEETYFERNNIEYLTTFNVPITLEKEVFGNILKEIKIDNYLIYTEVGNIIIDKIESSKTRIVMTFNLEDDKYQFMDFKNPRLIDDKGNIYDRASFYFSKDGANNICIEFTGEIYEDIKSLEFICDGIYYIDRNGLKIKVNLVDGYVEENPFGIEFDSYEGGILTLRATNVESLQFSEILGENGENVILTEGMSAYSNDNGEINEIKNYIRIIDEDLEEIDLEIYRILKDKTNPVEIDLIK